ncbi:hypothetical protein QR680_006041 [Steinernema hermaphroditum]|uniref:Nuclear receptor domain-containing protein n=1 Tax=Steinernema hermaphroditum TaxID=289476 RepID=A0AA39LWE9_9BILA|nr:hypothetical protein QR680_006041 [Steinernema hermaphroditum]
MVDAESCLICSAPAHGVHFQVNSCRACATFFRRAIGNRKSYKCRRAANNCRVARDEPYTCRYCRLQKCIKWLSMALIEDVKEILLRSKVSLPSKMTHTRKLQCAYRSLQRRARVEELQRRETLDLFEIIEYFESHMCNIAKWAMSCEEFAQLEWTDKWLIYKHLWPLVSSVDQFYNTIDLLGTDPNDTRVVLDNAFIIDMDTVTYDLPGVSDTVKSEFNVLFKTSDDRMVRNILIPMKELRLTEFEFVFLMAQCLWSIQGCHGISEKALKLAERFLEQISDEIHNYYFYELRMNNYAPRLTRLLKVLNECERQEFIQKGDFTIANVFNIFKCVEMENGLL